MRNIATRLLVLMFIALATPYVDSQITESAFRLVTNTTSEYQAAFQLGGQLYKYEAPSVVVCAAFCMKFDECVRYVWDSESKNCSVASSPDPAGQDLFFLRLRHCSTSLGYQMKYAGQTPMCVYFSSHAKNKPDAELACANLHGALARADTQEKIDLFVDLSVQAGNSHPFILVDGGDEAVEGTFTWSDGIPFTQETMNLFASNEPTNSAIQNAVLVLISGKSLMDAYGGFPQPFVCERIMFQ